MKKQKALFLFLCLAAFTSIVQAQSVTDMNKDAGKFSGRGKGGSGSSSGSQSNYSSSGGDAANALNGALFLMETFVYMGRGTVLLAKEEARLYRRNKEQNDLFCVEANAQGGYGFTDFTKLQPQVRLHLGCLSLDYRQTLLNDRRTEFNTWEFLGWMNFVNRPKFKLRIGVGSLGMTNNGNSYFLYGAGVEFRPTQKVRLELWGNLTQNFYGTTIRPRTEINLRGHYDFWQKGRSRASLFAGVSSQKYFGGHDFTTIDLGVNFMVSFHRFTD
jgi:hypothetical protein